MKLKRYETSEKFVSELERVGWFDCLPAESAGDLKQKLLGSKIDPKNYFTIPLTALGLYWDLESSVPYSEFVTLLAEANHHVVRLEVIREKPAKAESRVLLSVKVNDVVFKGTFDTGKWIDTKFIEFLKTAIEEVTDGFTLCSINGDGQDQILPICKATVVKRCSDEGLFPMSDEAQEEIAKMMYGE